MAERSDLIRASEIGEYIYCARSWWLRRVLGYTPAGQARREHGVELHARHGRTVAASSILLWLGILLALVTLVLLVIW